MLILNKKNACHLTVFLMGLLFLGPVPIETIMAQTSLPPSSEMRTIKKWPTTPLRGVSTKLVFPVNKNSSNPGGYLSDEIFSKLASWHVNVIRVAIGVDENSPWDIQKGSVLPQVPADDPLAPYRKHLEGLAVALALADIYNIRVILTAGNVAGRKIDVLYREEDGSGYFPELVKIWRHVASTYGSHPNLIGYDLLNEPVDGKEDQEWRDHVLPNLIQTVRRYDANTYLVIEAAPWGGSRGLKHFMPVADDKVVYSFHFYSPHSYTHQGIRELPKGPAYPGMLKQYANSKPLYWDKDRLRKSMAGALAFQKKHSAEILVGEFGVLRWSKGAGTWLSDVISLLEEYGWDWCFHGYGGWNGWNPSFPPEAPQRNETDGGCETEMLTILKKAWKENIVTGEKAAE